MSEQNEIPTPRTDNELHTVRSDGKFVRADFARTLERELIELRQLAILVLAALEHEHVFEQELSEQCPACKAMLDFKLFVASHPEMGEMK